MKERTDRRGRAQEQISRHPEHFNSRYRSAVLRGQVLLGMNPFEARSAGGDFVCEVRADPAKWPPQTDPLQILMSQSGEPDNSVVIMTFSNGSQYPERGQCTFKVHFRQGRVYEITLLRCVTR